MYYDQLARSSGSRSFSLARVLVFFSFFFKCGSQLPRRMMMMMAELIQGQASVAQPGTKDDFADTLRRVRQVKFFQETRMRRSTTPKASSLSVRNQGQDLGRSTPEYKHSSCTLLANRLTLSSRGSI